MTGLELLILWLVLSHKKKPGATGPTSEARTGRGHFAPDIVPGPAAPTKPGATGPATEARKGRGHF